MIDTHAHLNFAAYADDWEDVLERSVREGVSQVVIPGTDLASSERALALAAADPARLHPAIGCHPTALAHFAIEPYQQLVQKPGVVAIGEVGLDLYRITSGDVEAILSEQRGALSAFTDLAITHDLPLILHCRSGKKPGDQASTYDAHEELLAFLGQRQSMPRFVIHCFQGTADQARRYLELGGMISFTGTITYDDDRLVRDAVLAAPLDRMMLETDSPFLSPVPERGVRNEPWKIRYIAERVSVIHNHAISAEEILSRTAQVAKKFFRL